MFVYEYVSEFINVKSYNDWTGHYRKCRFIQTVDRHVVHIKVTFNFNSIDFRNNCENMDKI